MPISVERLEKMPSIDREKWILDKLNADTSVAYNMIDLMREYLGVSEDVARVVIWTAWAIGPGRLPLERDLVVLAARGKIRAFYSQELVYYAGKE